MGTQSSFSQPPIDEIKMWPFELGPDASVAPHQTLHFNELFMSPAHHPDPFSQSSAAELSSTLLPAAEPMANFIHPQELHVSSSGSESSRSPQSQHGSLDLTHRGSFDSSSSSSSSSSVATDYLSLDRQRAIRRLSLATSDLSNDTYRPRNTPARPRKSASSRITPRSQKHARELELNRKAATKCRNRQKAFVENLQARCKREEEKMHVQTSLLHALHDEVVALRNEIMRQSFCDCQFLKGAASVLLT
ncbi:hypothetical protein PV08_10605 [Exophiala spinifera]|uniref:BZIP domain-containing protein n=1 Tax=Exophiala spinifera TaxID=91928 RepID=A0A0D2AXY5_9EURO|nr:uncharacterized protein PV08_10605 [Exophiala spinifera]KIW11305.1 hypothetical protein PV08_10605 [Exophiala spinifera]